MKCERIYSIYISNLIYTKLIRKVFRVLILLSLLKYFLSAREKSLSNNSPIVCKSLCPYKCVKVKRIMTCDEQFVTQFDERFVCPQNFRNLADWVYGWPDQLKEHIHVTTRNATAIASCLPEGSIIYVRMNALQDFLENVYPKLENKFILITGDGVLSSPNNFDILHADNSKIIHWFGQNGKYHRGASVKFTHIPVGKRGTIKHDFILP